MRAFDYAIYITTLKMGTVFVELTVFLFSCFFGSVVCVDCGYIMVNTIVKHSEPRV